MIHGTRMELWPWPAEAGHSRSLISGVWVEWSGTEPTPTQLAIHLMPLKPRPMLDIIGDLNALTGPQKLVIWNNLNSGTPKKWKLSTGPNSSAIAAQATTLLLIQPVEASLNAQDVLDAKIWAVAMYMLDNPNYLVNPSFAPTINIPGWA